MKRPPPRPCPCALCERRRAERARRRDARPPMLDLVLRYLGLAR